MNTVEITLEILKELESVTKQIDPAQTAALLDEIQTAHAVYVAGSGRSLLMIRTLAIRLMQFGLRVYVVGESVTPAIRPGDLLIIASGSGETGTLVTVANQAKKAGARLALITIFPDSTIGRLSDRVVCIPAATSKTARPNTVTSFQPGANLFEQSLLLLCDALTLRLVEGVPLAETNARLMQAHANLE
jgi:6-phospho-3-hexuloisomerase